MSSQIVRCRDGGDAGSSCRLDSDINGQSKIDPERDTTQQISSGGPNISGRGGSRGGGRGGGDGRGGQRVVKKTKCHQILKNTPQ